MKRKIIDSLLLAAIATAVLMTVVSLQSCKSVSHVDRLHTEYVRKTDSLTQKDSIYIHDSILIRSVDDTIYHYKYRTVYKDRYRDRIKTDTLYTTDTLYIEKRTCASTDGGDSIAMLVFLACLSCVLTIALKRRYE